MIAVRVSVQLSYAAASYRCPTDDGRPDRGGIAPRSARRRAGFSPSGTGDIGRGQRFAGLEPERGGGQHAEGIDGRLQTRPGVYRERPVLTCPKVHIAATGMTTHYGAGRHEQAAPEAVYPNHVNWQNTGSAVLMPLLGLRIVGGHEVRPLWEGEASREEVLDVPSESSEVSASDIGGLGDRSR
jgi:hypothetical protein